MKAKTKQTNCEQTNSLTQVNTTYARICVILLALKFCVTGYVLTGVMKLQQEATVQTTTPTTPMTANAGAVTTPATPSTVIETLENK